MLILALLLLVQGSKYAGVDIGVLGPSTLYSHKLRLFLRNDSQNEISDSVDISISIEPEIYLIGTTNCNTNLSYFCYISIITPIPGTYKFKASASGYTSTYSDDFNISRTTTITKFAKVDILKAGSLTTETHSLRLFTGSFINETNVEMKVSTYPISILSGEIGCLTNENYYCCIDVLITQPGTYNFIISAPGHISTTSMPFTISETISSIVITSSNTQTVFHDFKVFVSLFKNPGVLATTYCNVSLSDSNSLGLSGITNKVITGKETLVISFQITGSTIISAKCGNKIANKNINVVKAILKIVKFTPPRNNSMFFYLVIEVYDYTGSEIVTANGPHRIELKLEPDGIIIFNPVGYTYLGSVNFNNYIATKNTYSIIASSENMESAVTSKFILEDAIKSISITSSNLTPSMNSFFNITISVFDKDGNISNDLIQMVLEGSSLSINKLPLYRILVKGTKIFTVFSDSVGIKPIIATWVIWDYNTKLSASLNLTVLPLFLKIDPIITIPKYTFDEFKLTVNVFDDSETLIKPPREPYLVTLTINPSASTQGTWSGTTSSAKIEFIGLRIASKGTFTITATSNNIESAISPQLTLLALLDSIILTVSTTTPSMNFLFTITANLLDKDGGTFEGSCVISLTESTSSIVGNLTDSITDGFKKFSVYSNSVGIKTIIATCPTSVFVPVVFGKLNINVLPLVLKVNPILKFPNFTKDEFELTVTVYDNSVTSIEALNGPYLILLILNPLAPTAGLWSGTTKNGKIEFKGLRLKIPGTYSIKVLSHVTIIDANTEAIIIQPSLSSIIVEPNKTTVKPYEAINFNISLFDESKNLFLPQKDVIITELNSEKFKVPNRIIAFKGELLISTYFYESGKKTLQFSVGNVLTQVEILVENSINPDPKCTKPVSSTVCINCVPGAVLSEGICKCSDNSEYSHEEHRCLCIKGYRKARNYCIKCGNYYSKSQITGEFSDDFYTIYLTFSEEPIKNIDCEDFLILPKSLDSILFSCTWEDIDTLSINFKEFPQVKDLVIGINPLKMQKASSSCKFNIEKLDISISYPGDLPVPFASINAPDTISLACSSNDVHISTPSIGRDYEYKWSGIYIPKNRKIIDLLDLLKDSSIQFPFSQLTIGTLFLTLKISSKSFNTFSTVTKTIEVVSEPKINVDFSTGSKISIKKTSNLSIKPIIKDSCNNSTSPYTYTWNYTTVKTELDFSSILSESSKGNGLFIRKNTLEAGNSYGFMVTVSDGSITGLNTVTVVVEESPLIIVLSRSSGTIGNDKDFALSSTVTDPDSITTIFKYSWSCREQTSQCLDNIGKKLLNDPHKNNILIPKSKLRNEAIYVFKLNVSTKTKTQSISIEIKVKAGLVGEIYIPKTFIKLNTDSEISVISIVKEINPLKINWVVITGKKVELPEDFTFFKIPPHTLTPRDTYEIELSLFNSDSELTTVYYFRTNAGAQCDNLNYESYSNNKIRLYGVNCVDGDDSDYPLTYQFGIDNNEAMRFVSSAIFTNEFTLKIGEGTLKGYLKVCDSLFSCSLNSTSISSNKRNLDDISDSFEVDTSDLENVPSAIVYYSTIATKETVEKMTEKLIEYIEATIVDSSELDLIITSTYYLYTSKTSPTSTQVNKVVTVLIDTLENIEFELTDSQVTSIYSMADTQIYLITTNNIRRLISIVRQRWINSKVPYSEVTFYSNLFVTHVRGLQSDYRNLRISGSALNLTFPEQFLINTTKLIDFSFAKYYKDYLPVFELQVFFSGYYENSTLVLESPEIHTNKFLDSLMLDYESNEFSTDSICHSIDYLFWDETNCKIVLLNETNIKLNLTQSSIFTLAETENDSNLYSIYRSVIYFILIFCISIVIFGYLCDKSMERFPHTITLLTFYPISSIMISQSGTYRLFYALHIASSQSLLLLLIGGYYKYWPLENAFKLTNVAKSGICLALSQSYSLLSVIFIFFTIRYKKLELVVCILTLFVFITCIICIIVMTLQNSESYIFSWIFGFLFWSPIDIIAIQFIYALIISKSSQNYLKKTFKIYTQTCASNQDKMEIVETKPQYIENKDEEINEKINEKINEIFNLEHKSFESEYKIEINQFINVEQDKEIYENNESKSGSEIKEIKNEYLIEIAQCYNPDEGTEIFENDEKISNSESNQSINEVGVESEQKNSLFEEQEINEKIPNSESNQRIIEFGVKSVQNNSLFEEQESDESLHSSYSSELNQLKTEIELESLKLNSVYEEKEIYLNDEKILNSESNQIKKELLEEEKSNEKNKIIPHTQTSKFFLKNEILMPLPEFLRPKIKNNATISLSRHLKRDAKKINISESPKTVIKNTITMPIIKYPKLKTEEIDIDLAKEFAKLKLPSIKK